MSIVLSAENVHHGYNGREVLNITKLEVALGEAHCLMGPNGAGKSTLLRILNLVEDPNLGTVRFEGKPVGTRSHNVRRRMAGVFQRPYMFAGSVFDNVAYGLKLRGAPKSELNRRVEAALNQLELSHLSDQSARRLSGGESQRVALARAIVIKPDILFLDEPTSFLDDRSREELFRHLRQTVSQENVTSVYVTHSIDEALSVADRISLLENGVLKQTRQTADLIKSDAPFPGNKVSYDLKDLN